MPDVLVSNSWVELDLDILGDNLRRAREAVSPTTRLIFVVKSNAYGHGMCTVARHARACGIRWFAVAHMEEACELRAILPDAEILVVGVIADGEAAEAIRCRAIPLIVSIDHARSLARAAASAGSPLHGHAKIDTGMGRLGFVWDGAARQVLEAARDPFLRIDGICTHFASSDSPDRSFADEQAKRFERVVDACRSGGLAVPFRHVSNSGATLREPGWDYEGVRPGILLYGYPPPSVSATRVIATRPFLQWKTRLLDVRRVDTGFPVSYDSTHRTAAPTVLGMIDVGYADGFSRLLSNCGKVLVGGRHCPVVGRVTMNLTVVDLGASSPAKAGAEVVLLGSQAGESIWADEHAHWRNTIPYEVLTDIHTSHRRIVKPRQPRAIEAG